MKKPSTSFGKALLKWHKTIDRPMPWKDTADPYHIWISEIILQQTRVAQGLKYYQNFVNTLPSVADLAAAHEDEVLSVWKGLGYYSRARNLHHAAQTIVEKHDGVFPNTYEDILALKGIGPYSAAAISSFAFGLPHAVLDGNVFRVLSRIYGIHDPIDTTEGRKLFIKYANASLLPQQAAAYNQAIMDFGATVCTPKAPKCKSCVWKRNCVAFQEDTVLTLPLKLKKIKIRKRYFRYFVIINDEQILLQRRKKGDIWTGLYEPPMIETEAEIQTAELNNKVAEHIGIPIAEPTIELLASRTQKLTHQTISATFYKINASPEEGDHQWMPVKELSDLAMPKIVDDFLGGYIGGGMQGELL